MVHKINHANIKEWAKNYDGPLFDGILCDPPYELGFMGKSWDSSGIAFDTEMWGYIYDLLKPGAHLLAFSGSRTYHRMAVAIEDAGFEIRDMIEYIYGSGFPKSTNVFKQLKKQCNCGNMEVYENRVQQVGTSREQETEYYLRFMQQRDLSQTEYTENKRGQVLQSSLSEQSTHDEGQTSVAGLSVSEGRSEPSVEGRSNIQTTKGQLQGRDLSEMPDGVSSDGSQGRLHNATPPSDGSIPEQIINENGSGASYRPQSEQQQYREPCTFCKQWGTQATRSYGTGSALKPSHEPICFARKPLDGTLASNYLKHGTGGLNIDGTRVGTESRENIQAGFIRRGRTDEEVFGGVDKNKPTGTNSVTGRFPANLIHDGSEEVEAVFPQTGSPRKERTSKRGGSSLYGSETIGTPDKLGTWPADNGGSASRFFYTAKASKRERNAGLEGFEEKEYKGTYADDEWSRQNMGNTPKVERSGYKNHHPTVKPLSLTKYLATLIKPPTGGRLLVPFSGSGSEMIGALQAGWEYVEGVELTEEYIPIAEARIKYWLAKKEEDTKQLELV